MLELSISLVAMIYDRLENAGLYSGVNRKIVQAVEYAKSFTGEDGKYFIDGEKMYANVETYQTGDENQKLFEVHRSYIDVQIMLSGSEMHGIMPLNNDYLTEDSPYNPEKDLVFYNTEKECSSIILSPGEFVVYYPQDCHKPGCLITTGSTVRKMVVKIAI